MKSLMIAVSAVVALGFSAPGFSFNSQDVYVAAQKASAQALENFVDAQVDALNWKVGDNLLFDLKVGTMITDGTAQMTVTKDTEEGFTMEQVMNLGQFGKQTAEMVLDKETGKIKKYTVNGQPQNPPDQGDMKVVKQESQTITVPKGTFDSIHVVLENAKKEITEAWINPVKIPMTGMLKMTTTQQGMAIVMELKDFGRGN